MKRPILSFLIAAAVAVTATTAWAEAPRRVVSIGGAVTEIIYALGAEKLIAGCDTTSTTDLQARSRGPRGDDVVSEKDHRVLYVSLTYV